MPFLYTAFDLCISSEIELPELLPGRPDAAPAVWICRGELPAHLSDSLPVRPRYFEAGEGKLLIRLKDVGRMLVEGGERITLQPQAGADAVNTRLALLNVGLSVLLHQRGYLVLHASAIVAAGKIVLFCGRRRAGKSTLAAALGQRGWALAGDDKVAIYLDGKEPKVISAFPQLRLWRDAMEQLAFTTEGAEQIPKTEKYNLYPRPEFTQEILPLGAIYVLKPQEKEGVSLQPLQGMHKVRVLRQHTYAPQFLKELGLLPAHFALISAIAARVPVVEIARPSRENRLEELVAVVETELRGLVV